MAFRRFMGVGDDAGHCWSDNSEETKAAAAKLLWPHDTSTPNRAATNGLIERAVQRTKEGTAACLIQSGLDDKWWDLAMQCFCFLRNVVDKLVLDTSDAALRNRELDSDKSDAALRNREHSYALLWHKSTAPTLILDILPNTLVS